MKNLIPSRKDMLDRLSNTHYDLIIIGGGITGVTVARDAVLRGLKTCLLEKGDFASGTSSMTSKMIHGGLRYLRNYEFKLVREAALERKVAMHIAPHLAEPMEFLVPLYRWNDEGLFLFRLGLFLYDLLAFPKQIGKHHVLQRKELIEKLPILENDEIIGGGSYFDIKTDDARFTLLNALSAMAHGADVLNYIEVLDWEDTGAFCKVSAKDPLSGNSYYLRSRSVVICGGPWTDIIEKRGKNFEGKTRLKRSRGTHILLERDIPDLRPSLLVNHDGRPIFVIPRVNGKILAGTTDVYFSEHPDEVKPPSEDVKYILSACNSIFPTVNFTNEDVVSCFAGVRPLVYKEGVSEAKISRNHTIHQVGNVISITGGKLTTARVMAKEVLNLLVKKILLLKLSEHRCVTHDLPLFSGEIDDWNSFLKSNCNRLIQDYNINESQAQMLLRWYGSEILFFEEFLQEVGSKPIEGSEFWLEAQIVYACRVEHAHTPVDFLRRRTPIMLERGNGMQSLDHVIRVMKEELDWDDEKTQKMREITLEYIKTYVAVPSMD